MVPINVVNKSSSSVSQSGPWQSGIIGGIASGIVKELSTVVTTPISSVVTIPVVGCGVVVVVVIGLNVGLVVWCSTIGVMISASKLLLLIDLPLGYCNTVLEFLKNIPVVSVVISSTAHSSSSAESLEHPDDSIS